LPQWLEAGYEVFQADVQITGINLDTGEKLAVFVVCEL
jgi:hypothetical protein